MKNQETLKNKIVTAEEKAAVRKNYPTDTLKILELPLDDFNTAHIEVVAIVPSRTVMGQYMKYIDINPKKAQDILLKKCLVTDKEIVLADDALASTAVSLIAELLPIREGRIKNF